jgi:DNA-binding transcriptional ArsR family regulator
MRIITELRKSSLSVNEITDNLKAEQSKVSHALANLKACNIVTCRSEGKQRIYSLNKKTIVPIFNIIDEHKASYCKGGCCAK